jgi:hypothetical protein
LLLVIQNKSMFEQSNMTDEKAYYKGTVSHCAGGAQNWWAGNGGYDMSNPAQPRQIRFMAVAGTGLHRIWYTGRRSDYASALPDGFTNYIMITIDMVAPTKPQVLGQFWLPGRDASPRKASPTGDIAYCNWRDACLAIIEVSDRSAPTLIAHKFCSPPFGGSTHNALLLRKHNFPILVDETVLDHGKDGVKPICIFDNHIRANPIITVTCPAPHDRDYHIVRCRFGPNKTHKNRPGTFVSEASVLTTYQNAGVLVYESRDPFRPEKVGACVTQPPMSMINPRPNHTSVLHSSNVHVASTASSIVPISTLACP